MSTNPDSRPLKTGWSEHYDLQRNVWFYINNNIIPPRMSVFHPADVPVTPETPSPQQQLTPEPSLNAALTSARRTQTMSFAQQLYASAKNSLPPSHAQPTTQVPNGPSGTTYAPSGQDGAATAPDSQINGSTTATQSITSVPPSSNPHEERNAFNASAMYNHHSGPGASNPGYPDSHSSTTQPHAATSQLGFRRSYTIAAPAGSTPVSGQAPHIQYETETPKPSAPPTVVLNPNPTPVYQVPTSTAAYPSPPPTNPIASTGPPSYPFPVVTSQSPEGSSPSSPPGYSTGNPGNQTALSPDLGTSTFSSSPTTVSSGVSPPSPTDPRAASVLSWSTSPTSVQTEPYPAHPPHHSYTAPPNFSLPTHYGPHPSASSPGLPNGASAANYSVPSNTYGSEPTTRALNTVPNPAFTGVAAPVTNYAVPTTSVPNTMMQTSIQPNYTIPQTTYPAAPGPIGYPSPPTSYPNTPMGVPIHANTYPQQQPTHTGAKQPAKPMTENQASAKVLLGIVKAVGQTAVKAATSNKDVLDTLADLPTNNQSGNNQSGGGSGGNDAMNGLANSFSGMMSGNNNPMTGFGGGFQQPDLSSQYPNSFSGMMSGNNNPMTGFGGGFQQPDLSSQYQNIMNQYQQLLFQQQQGQPTAGDPQQLVLQMQQLQQQMAQQQLQQQQLVMQQQMQLQQQQYQQQHYQYYQPAQQQRQGGATQGTDVVPPSAAELTTALRQATKYVKYGAKVAKFATGKLK